MGQPEQMPAAVASDNDDSEASASAGEIDPSYGPDHESKTNNKLKANEKLFFRTTIYFKKEAPSQHH